MSTFTKVLLATDLSPQADKLTECLFCLCPDTETEVVLAHVFDDDDDADPDGSISPQGLFEACADGQHYL